jgi:phosphoenolpyruvate phosphomutase
MKNLAVAARIDTDGDRAAKKKNSQFRDLLNSPELQFICEAHNGLSAKICEQAGFRGLWASGLCMSAQFGVRDSNEASWTQVLEMLEFMADATSVPILLDGDTGYGNFNNMRRLVMKLEQRDVSAVCIEDKLFPKTNSFINSTAQPLANMDEFCGKIKAAKDAQSDDEFSVIARVEALIAGWGMREALKRAGAYHEAGADGILIHSAKSTADEILEFKREWGNRSPVVIVPTKYYSTPTDIFRDAGFSIVIWANHILRSAVSAMQETAREIFEKEHLLDLEHRIASVSEVFRLQGADELALAEKRYLPKQSSKTKAIILAASRGKELGELTEKIPKAMVKIGERPLLEHIIRGYGASGVTAISVVRGYCKEAVNLSGIEYVDNDDYETTGELVSLNLALDAVDTANEDLVVSYGDVVFRRYILDALIESGDDFVIAVDAGWRDSVNRERIADYVTCSMPNSRRAFYKPVRLCRMAEDITPVMTHGEWVGMLKVSRDAIPRLSDATKSIIQRSDGSGRSAKMLDLFNELVSRGENVRVLYTTGHWLDVDSVQDVVAASSFE